MANIYDISNWNTNINYNIEDIVFYNGFYYYATTKHNSGFSFDDSMWDGVINFNGTNKPFFLWKPSYNSEVPIKPAIKKIQFGDGYSQANPDGINNILLTLNLTFDLRTEAQARAILHFLNQRAGYQSFVFTPLPPYAQNKLFRCEDFSSSYVFKDNFTIRAVFNETPI